MNTSIEIDADRLKAITALAGGAHHENNSEMCVMEAVAFVAREPWSDQPQCACPVIGAFLRSWNDSLPNNERNELLLPLIPRLVGTRGSKALEERRSLMAVDWIVRTHTPAWLRLAGLTVQADALSSLPEITSMAQVPSIKPAIDAARTDAAAAWAAARAAARDAAGAAAWATAWDAARAAARAAAWDAANAAAKAAAWAVAKAAAWNAAGAAGWAVAKAEGAAKVAAWGALADTRKELQRSALALVGRMIEARD